MAALLTAGCAYHKPKMPGTKQIAGRSCQEPEELLDVLTRFATAVQARRYHNAIALLTREDQARMVVAEAAIGYENL